MTGRELVIFIMENGLEDSKLFENGTPGEGFHSLIEAAHKFDVGEYTIKVWCERGLIPALKIGDAYYIPKNAKRPNLLR